MKANSKTNEVEIETIPDFILNKRKSTGDKLDAILTASELAIVEQEKKDAQHKRLVEHYSKNRTLLDVGVQPFNTNSLVKGEVQVNQVDSYFKQITNNFFVASQGVYLCARDLAQAKKELQPLAYEQLERSLYAELRLSEGTLSKWITVGKNDCLFDLYKEQRLPYAWTTNYMLAQWMTKDDSNLAKFKAIASDIEASSTAEEINNLIGETTKVLPPAFEPYKTLTTSMDFIKVAFEKKTTDANVMRFLQKEIGDVVDRANVLHEELNYHFSKEKDNSVKPKVAMTTKVGAIETADTAYITRMTALDKSNAQNLKGKNKSKTTYDHLSAIYLKSRENYASASSKYIIEAPLQKLVDNKVVAEKVGS